MDYEGGMHLYQVATIKYPLAFDSAFPVKDGLLLKDEKKQYYLLKEYKGSNRELLVSLEAEKYLIQKGFSWIASALPLMGGKNDLEHGGQCYYLKYWQPEDKKLPFHWQLQFGSELLARVHLYGENFHPENPGEWEWPDWVKLFEMARDTVYELHTVIINTEERRLLKYFDKNVKEALVAMEEAIVHLKKAGYYDQRSEGMHRGYISLSQIPAIRPGIEFDLLEYLTPDLPACGLGSFLGQVNNFKQVKAINDVIDLIHIYNKTRKLNSDEIDLIKGFLKFPWNFWWITEDFFIKGKDKKKEKRYGKELKALAKSRERDVYRALEEL